MSNEKQALLAAALALPEAERELLTDRLLDSLSPESDAMSADAFYAELERRAAELDRDPSSAIPWSDVKRML
jgi:putative addiction module component (TIGR02574 family)